MASSKLASNVLNSISSRIKYEDSPKDNILILFTGSNLNIDNKLSQIKRLKENGKGISIGFSFMAERVLDLSKIKSVLNPLKIYFEEDIFNLKNIMENYSVLYCPSITMSTLSKISLGLIDTFVSNTIWTFLYQGKEVYMDFDSVRHFMGIDSKNKGISNMVNNYINISKEMGVKEIQWDKSFKSDANESIVSPISSEAKTIITERDILKLNKNQIILDKNTLITPLAKDRARELGIEIKIK